MPNWNTIAWILYAGILIIICLRIIYDTRSSSKTMAYLLFTIFIPVFGMIFYLLFGVNYWKKKLYNKKMAQDKKILSQLKKDISVYTEVNVSRDVAGTDSNELASMLVTDLHSPLTRKNRVKLLVNGEEKFPELRDALQQAKHHIHIEYYIYEQDEIGMEIIELLIKKAKEGIQVRFIYDDFGSPSIKNKIEKRMQEAGVQVHPFHKVHFYLLANRLNYRNHRKIVVIDGQTAFVGGINISDKYINNKPGQMYWRDTHMRIDGPGVFYLQYLFISDWNFCCPKALKPEQLHFVPHKVISEDTYLQVSASGPDSLQPSVLFSLLQVIYLAKEEILITTPYFIPGDSILEALRVAALSGLSVKLLVPGVSDSKFVNAASKSHYAELLRAGVDIYLYQKGFVHAKTLITDSKMSVIGTANMDYRSFELNFEVNVIVYDKNFATQMRNVFFNDLKDAEKIDPELWHKRRGYEQFPEKIARLFSPIM
ncbi:MAG: cardiolipin synthase [Ferruginibacter sp.]|nr:cardiolipin synthase [Chitinophagaceae bacterium]